MARPALRDCRQQARQLLGDVARKGDPAAEKRAARKAHTVSELCDLYFVDATAGRLMTRHRSPKRHPHSLRISGRIERHIKPLLGRRTVARHARRCRSFMHDVAAGKTTCRTKTKPRGLARVRGGRGTATRTMGLLGAIFAYAVRYRMRPDNPVHGVTRFADGKRERRLSDDDTKPLATRCVRRLREILAGCCCRSSLPDPDWLAKRRGVRIALG